MKHNLFVSLFLFHAIAACAQMTEGKESIANKEKLASAQMHELLIIRNGSCIQSAQDVIRIRKILDKLPRYDSGNLDFIWAQLIIADLYCYESKREQAKRVLNDIKPFVEEVIALVPPADVREKTEMIDYYDYLSKWVERGPSASQHSSASEAATEEPKSSPEQWSKRPEKRP